MALLHIPRLNLARQHPIFVYRCILYRLIGAMLIVCLGPRRCCFWISSKFIYSLVFKRIKFFALRLLTQCSCSRSYINSKSTQILLCLAQGSTSCLVLGTKTFRQELLRAPALSKALKALYM